MMAVENKSTVYFYTVLNKQLFQFFHAQLLLPSIKIIFLTYYYIFKYPLKNTNSIFTILYLYTNNSQLYFITFKSAVSHGFKYHQPNYPTYAVQTSSRLKTALKKPLNKERLDYCYSVLIF